MWTGTVSQPERQVDTHQRQQRSQPEEANDAANDTAQDHHDDEQPAAHSAPGGQCVEQDDHRIDEDGAWSDKDENGRQQPLAEGRVLERQQWIADEQRDERGNNGSEQIGPQNPAGALPDAEPVPARQA